MFILRFNFYCSFKGGWQLVTHSAENRPFVSTVCFKKKKDSLLFTYENTLILYTLICLQYSFYNNSNGYVIYKNFYPEHLETLVLIFIVSQHYTIYHLRTWDRWFKFVKALHTVSYKKVYPAIFVYGALTNSGGNLEEKSVKYNNHIQCNYFHHKTSPI